jgi:hypothetical protein
MRSGNAGKIRLVAIDVLEFSDRRKHFALRGSASNAHLERGNPFKNDAQNPKGSLVRVTF